MESEEVFESGSARLRSFFQPLLDADEQNRVTLAHFSSVLGCAYVVAGMCGLQ